MLKQQYQEGQNTTPVYATSLSAHKQFVRCTYWLHACPAAPQNTANSRQLTSTTTAQQSLGLSNPVLQQDNLTQHHVCVDGEGFSQKKKCYILKTLNVTKQNACIVCIQAWKRHQKCYHLHFMLTLRPDWSNIYLYLHMCTGTTLDRSISIAPEGCMETSTATHICCKQQTTSSLHILFLCSSSSQTEQMAQQTLQLPLLSSKIYVGRLSSLLGDVKILRICQDTKPKAQMSASTNPKEDSL